MKKLPLVTIVGRPNVGKSTLFNRLLGRRRAVTSRTPGTTRDSLNEKIHWNGNDFLLVDSAGLISDFFGFEEASIEKMAQNQIDLALKVSDLVLLVVDAKEGVLEEDCEVARKVRKFGKKVLLVANKVDDLPQEKNIDQYSSLGFDEIIGVSAITGRRSGDLLDKIITMLPSVSEKEQSSDKKIALIGRPNVGKSTLFNALIGSDKAIVSDIAGTTRDSLKFTITIDKSGEKKSFEFIDTAGFRKRGKIVPGIEKFSIIRSIESIYEADLVILVVDSKEGLTRTDAHLAQFAKDKSKKLIIVLNKVDLLTKQIKEEIPNLERFYFLTKIPMIAISAKSGENLDFLKSEIVK